MNQLDKNDNTQLRLCCVRLGSGWKRSTHVVLHEGDTLIQLSQERNEIVAGY